jgi:hypothetical protein
VGATAAGLEASCTLVLRGPRFELGCRSAGWQSAEAEYLDGSAELAGTTLTLSAPRRYLKRGDRIAVIDHVPNTLAFTFVKEGDGAATITGDFPGGRMTLKRR